MKEHSALAGFNASAGSEVTARRSATQEAVRTFNPLLKPELAILILNFDGYDNTRRALESLRLISQLAVCAIVIDNGSKRDEAALLRAEFPEAIVERSEENLGFSRGINYAATIALQLDASYILLLNNDAWLENPDSSLLRLIATLRSNPTLAAVGPLIVEDDGSERVQSAGYRFSLWWPLPRAVLRARAGSSGFTYLSACCLLIRSATFAELAGFDPDFFLYGEDVDFGLRVKQAGSAMALVPDVRVHHQRGASSHLLSERYVYNALRGNLVVTLKHVRWYQLPSATLGSIVITLGLSLIAYRNGTKNAIKVALKAWVDFVCGRWGGLEGGPLRPADRPRLDPMRHAAMHSRG